MHEGPKESSDRNEQVRSIKDVFKRAEEARSASVDPTDSYYKGILAAKSLLDKKEFHLITMIFNLRLSVTSEPHGMYYEAGYCFHSDDSDLAWKAFAEWDGEGTPEGFLKDLQTGEYGPGLRKP